MQLWPKWRLSALARNPKSCYCSLTECNQGTASHSQLFFPLHAQSSKWYLNIIPVKDTTSRWWENNGPDPLEELLVNSWMIQFVGQIHITYSTPAADPGTEHPKQKSQGSYVFADVFLQLYTGGQQTFTQRWYRVSF